MSRPGARRALVALVVLAALGAPAGRAFGLGVVIEPVGSLAGDGSVATVRLRVTCAAEDRNFVGVLTLSQGAAKGTKRLQGDCRGAGSTLLEQSVPADRLPSRPRFRPGRADASVRLTGDDPLRGPSRAADSRSIELR